MIAADMEELALIEQELQRRDNVSTPLFYHLPDLLFPKGYTSGTYNPDTNEIEREPLPQPETDAEYISRQETALKQLVEKWLSFLKDGRIINLVLIDKQVSFISDLFFRRTKRAILWKPRGGGGSLSAAILIWLCMIYHRMSFVDLGGSQEQARVVYDYVCAFWDCVPGLRENLVDGNPLISRTQLITGVGLRCLTTTEKQARGKHLPGLIADEACQQDMNVDKVFRAAMNITMSEDDHIILILSTFHIPIGLFQDIWDTAEKKGFTRYKWDTFDVMQPCQVGMEFATKDDTEAREFCRTSCPLTLREEVFDDKTGELVGYRYEGCDGRGRHSTGFMPRENVINAMVLNDGTEIFRVEFMCYRPQFSGPIYGLKAIEDSMTDQVQIDDNDQTVVGIDWGITEGVLVLGKDSPEHGPQIIASRFLSVKLVSEYIRTLDAWQEEFGHLEVYADASHPFEIGDLEEAGFTVIPVDFSTMKDYGIANLTKLFMYGKIAILDDNDQLLVQLKQYHRDPKTGKPRKIADHGPDAVLCLTVTIDFMERWPELLTAKVRGLARQKPEMKIDENTVDTDKDVMLF